MNQFLVNIIYGINSVVGNYGWAIVCFTLLIRLVCMPLDYKSRLGMKKQSKLAPQVTALQKKYEKDPEKMNRKVQELYKKEGVNPLSSCLPMIIMMALLWIMFDAMRKVANENLIQQVFEILEGETPVMDSWLWVKNIWQPDSPVVSSWPSLSTLQAAANTDLWTAAFRKAVDAGAVLPETLNLSLESFAKENLSTSIQNIYAYMETLPAYVDATAHMPGWPTMSVLGLFRFDVMKYFNGYFILPILACSSQVIMNKLTPQQASPAGNDEKAQQAQQSSKIMQWFFPIFTLFLCANYNAVFAIYWVASNVFAAVGNVIINRVIEQKEAQAAAGAEDGKGSL